MKIGVLSDSHGDIYGVRRAIKKMGKVDYIIHLGDYCRDAEMISKELKLDIIYVKGNCDFSASVDNEKVMDIGGRKFLITHGHNLNVKNNYTNLYYRAAEAGADVALFGHTHFAHVFENEGILFVNPGSISRPRSGAETYAVITIENGIVTPNIVELY